MKWRLSVAEKIRRQALQVEEEMKQHQAFQDLMNSNVHLMCTVSEQVSTIKSSKTMNGKQSKSTMDSGIQITKSMVGGNDTSINGADGGVGGLCTTTNSSNNSSSSQSLSSIKIE